MTTYTFNNLTRIVKLKQIVDPKGEDTKTLEDTLIYIKELEDTKENLVLENTRLESELYQKKENFDNLKRANHYFRNGIPFELELEKNSKGELYPRVTIRPDLKMIDKEELKELKKQADGSSTFEYIICIVLGIFIGTILRLFIC